MNVTRPIPPVGCVIMASGMGKRFGSNKLLADFGGKPLIHYILEATGNGLFDKRVVVTRHSEVVRICEDMGVPVILHDFPGRNDTVRLGLEYLTKGNQAALAGCMFCPADQPLIRRETLETLVLSFLASPGSIYRPAYFSEESMQPGSPVLFDHKFFPELLTLPQDKGGGFVAKKYPEQIRYIPVRDSFELLDVDTPEMLRNLTLLLFCP